MFGHHRWTTDRRLIDCAAWVLPLALAAYAPAVLATDMSGVAIIAGLIWFAVVGVVTLALLFACRWIAERRARALVRLLILVALYTPVPPVLPSSSPQQTLPSFVFWTQWLWTARHTPGDDARLQAAVLATGIVLLLGLSVIVFWAWISERHASGPATPSARE